MNEQDAAVFNKAGYSDAVSTVEMEEAAAFRRKEFVDHWESLSFDQRSSLKFYQSEWYEPINGYLRDGSEIKDEVIKKDIAALDSTMTHPMSQDTVVYRGMQQDVSGLEVGDEYSDKAFVSTTLAYSTADAFATKDYNANEVMCEILVPKGARCTVTVDPAGASGEHEILLPRDSKFKVVGKEKLPRETDSGDKYEMDYLYLEMLP